MPWNWELKKWPHFTCRADLEAEKKFLLKAGKGSAFLKNIGLEESSDFVVEILSLEGEKSSKIEGEILDRESLQSSIKQHFGLPRKKPREKESNMAGLLCNVYESYHQPLTHKMLESWHKKLFHESEGYRAHKEPMQIVSHRYDARRVFFEAPPSSKVRKEMDRFIKWFNASKNEPTLMRAAITHVYFESIHPFEDGNGRIGRVLVEKALSQGVGHPCLIAVSKVLERKRKEYYSELGKCNRTLEIQDWIDYFSKVVLEGQKESMELLQFLIAKAKLLASCAGQINERQEKVLLRMFKEGPTGFKGGLSAENYITITKASRATATRDLADLVERGALKKTGELRHTRYSLKLVLC